MHKADNCTADECSDRRGAFGWIHCLGVRRAPIESTLIFDSELDASVAWASGVAGYRPQDIGISVKLAYLSAYNAGHPIHVMLSGVPELGMVLDQVCTDEAGASFDEDHGACMIVNVFDGEVPCKIDSP